MVDFIEQVHLGLISHRPYGTGDDCWMLTQDCAALVLGYYPISLREKDRCRFHLSRVGNAGGGLTLIRAPLEFFGSLFSQ
jgi:hypothetical protein